MNAASAQLLDVPLDDIRPHPDNPRRNLGDLADLAASILAQGILEPLLVEPYEGRGKGGHKYQLIAGHRRLAASAQAGLKTVPVVVRAATSLAPQVLAMLTENGQRSDLTPVEEGDAYQLLLDLPSGALTVDEISASVGRSKRAVQERLKITKLPETAQQRILRGQLDLDHAARMAGFANDAAAMARLDRAAEAGPIALERALEQEKASRTRKANLQKAERALKKEARADGVAWVDPDDVDGETAIGLDELLGFLTTEQIGTVAGIADGDQGAEQGALDEWHKDCPGRARSIFETDYASNVFHMLAVCTKPELHEDETAASVTHRRLGDDTDAAAAAEARAQREAEQVALTALTRRLKATGVARRRFLGEVIRSKAVEAIAHKKLVDDFGPMLAAKHERDVTGVRLLAQVLLPNISDEQLHAPGVADRVRKALEKASVPQLVVYHQLRRSIWMDAALDNPTHWQWSESRAGGWRDELVDVWGWERFPEEQALIDGRPALDVAREFCGGDTK